MTLLQLKVEWHTIQSLKKYCVEYIINKIYIMATSKSKSRVSNNEMYVY